MQRRNAIAVAGAVTGILVAGSVASVAVINAASTTTSTDQVPIVAASVVEPPAAQVVQPAVVADQPRLPKIVVPEQVEASAGAKARQTADAATITAQQAQQAAIAATPGSVLSTTRVARGGYDAFAVQIERTDGSVVTGYVEATSGVVFDWVIDKQAPAPVATYADDDDDDDYDDDHGDDHDDDDDHDDHDDRDDDDD